MSASKLIQFQQKKTVLVRIQVAFSRVHGFQKNMPKLFLKSTRTSSEEKIYNNSHCAAWRDQHALNPFVCGTLTQSRWLSFITQRLKKYVKLFSVIENEKLPSKHKMRLATKEQLFNRMEEQKNLKK